MISTSKVLTADKIVTKDLQTLHEIVSLATVFPGKSSFRAIWRAYDVVLAARNINPAHDSTYFRFILQLQGVEGRDIYDRFMVLLAVYIPIPHGIWLVRSTQR